MLQFLAKYIQCPRMPFSTVFITDRVRLISLSWRYIADFYHGGVAPPSQCADAVHAAGMRKAIVGYWRTERSSWLVRVVCGLAWFASSNERRAEASVKMTAVATLPSSLPLIQVVNEANLSKIERWVYWFVYNVAITALPISPSSVNSHNIFPWFWSSFLNDTAYREAIENSSNYNTRLCRERRLRMPFLDSQTGDIKSHTIFSFKLYRVYIVRRVFFYRR